MKRVFWFAVGAGVGIYGLMKLREYLQKSTPEAIGNRVADSATGISASLQDFAVSVRAAMAERETELRDELGLPQGDS